MNHDRFNRLSGWNVTASPGITKRGASLCHECGFLSKSRKEKAATKTYFCPDGHKLHDVVLFVCVKHKKEFLLSPEGQLKCENGEHISSGVILHERKARQAPTYIGTR